MDTPIPHSMKSMVFPSLLNADGKQSIISGDIDGLKTVCLFTTLEQFNNYRDARSDGLLPVTVPFADIANTLRPFEDNGITHVMIDLSTHLAISDYQKSVENLS